MPELKQFIEWAFMAIISGGVGWTVTFLGRISRSISALNEQVAVIIERTATHERELNRHDERLSNLESKTTRRGGH